MKEIVDISTYTYLNDLERAHFEYQSHQNIISYMLANNQYLNAGFKFYQNECTKALQKYENEKKRFEQNVIIPLIDISQLQAITWNIDFQTKEVEIVG